VRHKTNTRKNKTFTKGYVKACENFKEESGKDKH
jgi:hypothetical protein